MQVHAAHAPTGPFGQTLVDTLAPAVGEDGTAALKAALQGPGSFDSTCPHVMGWCEVHFSHLLASAEVDYVTRAVVEVASHAWQLLPQYCMDPATGAP